MTATRHYGTKPSLVSQADAITATERARGLYKRGFARYEVVSRPRNVSRLNCVEAG